MLEIGDKVICVNSFIEPEKRKEINKDVPNWVVKNNIYTIREFNENNGIVLGILLVELKNPIKYFKLINSYQESSFAVWRFEKLQDNIVNENQVMEAMKKEDVII